MMTVVDVKIPAVRATNTPAGVADRIPPRVNTQIQGTVQPYLGASGQMVTLAKLNNNATNGDFTIGGSVTQNLTTTTTVNPSGTTQTAPTGGVGGGNAGKLNLVSQVNGRNAFQTSSFTLSAIPPNSKDTFIHPL